jgi:hypothetical protein
MIATYSLFSVRNLRMSFVPLAFSPRKLVHCIGNQGPVEPWIKHRLS